MRDKFFKYLKRFFILLPLIMMILQIVFSMGSYWRENATDNFYIGDNDFITMFVDGGNWNNNDILNPLLFDLDTLPVGIYKNIQYSFARIWGLIYTMNNTQSEVYIEAMFDYPGTYPYFIIIINFLTWWVFVELMFLFFRFVTFLISWVNSLFDRCYNKINKG